MVGTPLNEYGQIIVHQVPQAVLEHFPEEHRKDFDLRPIEMLPETTEETYNDRVYPREAFPVVQGNQCWVERVTPRDAVTVQPLMDPVPLIFSMGRNTGKSLTTADIFDNIVSDERPMDALENFFTGFYKRLNGTLNGYMGEARPRKVSFNWEPELTIIGRKRFWLYPTYTSLIGPNGKDIMRVCVPARRRAGFAAYKSMKRQDLQILKPPKPLDWSFALFEEEVRNWYRPAYGPDGLILLKQLQPGQRVTVTYSFGTLRFVDPYKERPSERRARLSSTADSNGKPRRK
jgi:hypothetical protein